jgi:LysR family glycine cleavage system transcriptional activator
MTLRFPPLNSLRAFEAAARHLSFKKAAQELNVTPAAVSQQIKALEKHLEVPLFRRVTRGLELTEAGAKCLPKLREGFEALAEAVESIRVHKNGKILRVSVPPSLAAKWLAPKLHRFMNAHPNMDVRIVASMSLIDGQDTLDSHYGEDEGEGDIEIRFGSGNYPGFQVDKLFPVCLVPLCSPKLLKGEHPLRVPEDLRHHTLLHDDTLALAPQNPGWEMWLAAAGVSGVDPTRGSHFSHASLALAAAVDGLGVAVNLSVLAAEHVAAGHLVVPFDPRIPLTSAYYLLTPEAKETDPNLAAFREWLLKEARAHEAICPGPELLAVTLPPAPRLGARSN